MKKSTIVITGCDDNFYPFLEEALNSLVAINIDQRAEIGILDLGLSPEHVADLQAFGCTIRQPTWAIDVPEHLKIKNQQGLIARTGLRDYFPGFEVYIWFDADAWAQTPEFFDQLVAGAQAQQAAVVRENGYGYSRNLIYHRWWYGHMMATYGVLSGIQRAIRPAVNIGIMALKDTAPHWQAWVGHYKKFIHKRKKLNLDQHAFNAALDVENLPYAEVSARCNWICTLSTPVWDPDRRLMCEPGSYGKPLSVLHLAGPDKRRIYDVRQTSGDNLATPLTYSALLPAFQ